MTVRPPTAAWALATAAAIATLALALAPPFLAPDAARAVVRGFSWLCHQLPDRTLHVHGVAVALCHRCLGIGGGVLLGLMAAPVAPRAVASWRSSRQQARVLLLAAVPLAVDWTLGATDLWANTAASRSLTGAVWGLAAGLLIGTSLLSLAPATTERPGDNLLAPRT